MSKPQKFLRVFRHFWGSVLSVESWSSTEIFWASSENSEDEMNNEQQKNVDPQNFLRACEDLQKFLRIDLFVVHPQFFLGILRFFWGLTCLCVEKWSSSEVSLNKRFFQRKYTFFQHTFIKKSESSKFSEDPQKNSEDDQLSKNKTSILRKFWGSSKFWGWTIFPKTNVNPQKILRMTVVQQTKS